MRINQKQSLYESFMNNLKEGTKTQDFINQVGADNDAKRLAGITGDYMTLDQYEKYQSYLHDIRKNDTSRYDITIEYWDRNGYPQEKTYIGRSLKEIAKKFVAARDKYDFREVGDYSDNLYELVNHSTCSDIEEYLESIYNGATPESLVDHDLDESDDIDHIVQRGNVYIPVRKGETEETAIKRAENTNKPVGSEKSISFTMPRYSQEFKAELFKDRDALIASYDPSQVDPKEVSRKIQAGEELNKQESMWFINQEPKKGDVILGDIVRKVASDGKWVDIDRYDDYEKDPVANADAADEVEDDIDLEKASKDIRKTMRDMGIEESAKLYETTNKGIQAKKDALHDKMRQALKDAGDKDWENLVDYTKRLPKEVVEELDKEEDEIWCIEMIHSILTYTSDRDIDSLIKDRYLQKYIEEFGEEKVRELLAGEIEEYKNATIHQNVHTDSEGVSYNSVTFKDDINESNLTESEKVIWTSDSTEQYDGWSDEDFINEYRNQTGEEPEDAEQAREWFINDDDIAVWDVMVEDLESMIPSIQEQTTDNIIFMCGTVGRWTGNHGGGKVIQVDDAKDLLFGDDLDVVRLVDDNGNIEWQGIHHDGTHHMWLYAMPKDEATREKLVRELGIVDWYKDMYQYDNPEKDALDDALNDLYSASRLNDILEPKDFATISQICQPIKNNIN